MTTKTRSKPQAKRITGVAGTEEYLPEPKLDGALLRLRNDRGDFSRVQEGAVSLLSIHDEERVLGHVRSVMPAGDELRFAADLPVGQGVRRVDDYAADFDAGLRGRYSLGYGIRAIEVVGRRNGVPMVDADWVLTEISDTPKPVDLRAKADRATASWVSDEALASVRSLGDFGQVNIHPGGRVARHDNLQDLDLGNFLRLAMRGVPGGFGPADCKRELAWIERNLGRGFYAGMPNGGSCLPFSVLATSGPEARRRATMRAERGVSHEQHLESFFPAAEAAIGELLRQEEISERMNRRDHVRTLTQATTSAGAMSGIMVDVAHSIMWLTEMDSALELMTVVPGLMAPWQSFYGNVAPVVSWNGEGMDLTEQTPTLTRLQRESATMGIHFSLSTAAVYGSDNDLAAILEAGSAEVVRTQYMRAILSGDDVGAMFAADTDAFDGLMNSGITETNFGAAITDLGRQDLIDARRRLRSDQARSGPDDLGWLLSEDVAQQLEITARSATGGSDFLYQDGMVDTGAHRYPARESVHLGKTGVTAPAVLVDKACALALIWGPGIAINRLQIPGRTKVDCDLQLQGNFAFMDPRRAEVLKQA